MNRAPAEPCPACVFSISSTAAHALGSVDALGVGFACGTVLAYLHEFVDVDPGTYLGLFCTVHQAAFCSMVEAFADSLDLNPEDLLTRLGAERTPQPIAH